MCDECRSEFRGWCGSFTRRERALAAAEGLLLALLVALLSFLVLHLAVCPAPPDAVAHLPNISHPETAESEKTTRATAPATGPAPTEKEPKIGKTVDPDLECSWTPSAGTAALVHRHDRRPLQTTREALERSTAPPKGDIKFEAVADDFAESDRSDGEEAAPPLSSHAAALVKLRPPRDEVFGCTLSAVAARWTLTAASCVEAVEEVDALDSFVIVERYGAGAGDAGEIHAVADLRVHPSYRGADRGHDLAALRTDTAMRRARPLRLPTALHRATVTVGERFLVLGYGAYRSIDKSATGRRLRRAFVYTLPSAQCPGSAAWALRHLSRGAPAAAAAACGAAPLCAGALYARGLPCNYCSGTPLVAASAGDDGAALVGIMSDNPQCGVACEPQLFVNVAAVGDWIESVVHTE